LPNGVVELLGRLDRQLKIRGQRIEPGEVEAVIRQSEYVLDCAVTATECDDDTQERCLVAFVVSHADDSPDIDQLCVFMRKHLPSAAIPTQFVLVDSLPATANGKVDYRALQRQVSGGASA